MDDLEPVPQEDLPEAPAGAEVPHHDLPADAEVPASDLPKDMAAQPQGETSTLGAAAEGLAKGIAGPVATAAELGLSKLGVPGLSAAEQTQRQEQHPYAEGAAEATGLIGSAFVPFLGEYTLGSKIAMGGAKGLEAANLAAKALGKSEAIGKVGATAIKLGIEGGLFHLSDNASKMILGQTDPNAPVASFLAGTPAAVLLGGGLGVVAGKAAGKLQEIANSATANKASQWLADLGSRFDLLSKHGGMEGTTEAGADQAQHLYDTVKSAINDGFSLKRDSIEKLTQNIDPANTSAYVNSMRANLAKLPKSLAGNSAVMDAVNDWHGATSPTIDPMTGAPSTTPSAADVFEATDSLKRRLQEIGFAEKNQNGILGRDLAKNASALQGNIKTSLENPGMWGDMGDFQKKLNGAYSKILDPMSDFESTAMQDVGGSNLVDKGKIYNLFRQVGKGKLSADIRTQKIANFFEPAQNLLKTVGDLHAAQGLESNIPAVSTDVIDEMLKRDLPAGAKVASWLFDAGQSSVGMAGSHIAGTVVGGAAGHPYLGYRAGEAVYPLFKELGKKPTRWAVSGLLRAMSSGDYAGIPQAINYANGIHSGAQRIENSVNNIFNVGGKQYLESDHSDTDREKLKKFVEEGALNQQVQNQGNQTATPKSEEQKFATGGEVLVPKMHPVATKPVGKAVPADHLGTVFPEQSMLLGAAKSRINNYLNSVRPQAVSPKLPFDEHMENKEHDRSYGRALDIANKPLSVLDHIKGGTLEPEHVKHMQGLYPELADHLRQKIAGKITDAQMANEKPPYHVRQGLSLFMGSALDSNLTPQNIMAAQSTFAAQKMPPMPGAMGKPKKGTASLENEPNQYRTSAQSAQLRQSHVKP